MHVGRRICAQIDGSRQHFTSIAVSKVGVSATPQPVGLAKKKKAAAQRLNPLCPLLAGPRSSVTRRVDNSEKRRGKKREDELKKQKHLGRRSHAEGVCVAQAAPPEPRFPLICPRQRAVLVLDDFQPRGRTARRHATVRAQCQSVRCGEKKKKMFKQRSGATAVLVFFVCFFERLFVCRREAISSC